MNQQEYRYPQEYNSNDFGSVESTKYGRSSQGSSMNSASSNITSSTFDDHQWVDNNKNLRNGYPLMNPFPKEFNFQGQNYNPPCIPPQFQNMNPGMIPFHASPFNGSYNGLPPTHTPFNGSQPSQAPFHGLQPVTQPDNAASDKNGVSPESLAIVRSYQRKEIDITKMNELMTCRNTMKEYQAGRDNK